MCGARWCGVILREGERGVLHAHLLLKRGAVLGRDVLRDGLVGAEAVALLIYCRHAHQCTLGPRPGGREGQGQ